MKVVILLVLTFVLSIQCKTYDVSSANELKDALDSVNPGDTIILQDGEYHGTFIAERSGSEDSPITMKGANGSKNVVLSGSNYGFWLKANYWTLKDFSVSDSKKGIVLEGASHCVLEELEVSNIQQEGIHFRYNSADNILQKSIIHDTGLSDPGFGEGVYIGQAVSNWLDGKQDKSDRNQILYNTIGPNIAAECIDIKEGTCCGVVKDNVFDGTGMSGENSADSWVDVKGDSYTISENKGSHSINDGFQIHHISNAGMGGCDNTIENNHCVDISGECATSASKGCSNTIKNNN